MLQRADVESVDTGHVIYLFYKLNTRSSHGKQWGRGNNSKKSDYVALFKGMRGRGGVSPKVTKIDQRQPTSDNGV